MKNLKLAIAVTVMAVMLTGCWDTKEIEHMFYAHAVGIDYVDNQFQVYVQVVNFETLAKAESGGQGTQGIPAWVGTAKGDTIDTAYHNLYATSQREIFWGHLNAIVLGESVLKNHLEDVLDIVTRYNEFRYTPWIFGARGSIRDILLTSPILEASPVYSQLSAPDDVFKISSFIPPVRLHRFIATFREPGSTALLPVIEAEKGYWSDEEKNYNALKLSGVHILRNRKWQGWENITDLHGLRWVDKRTERTPLIIQTEQGPKAVLIMHNPKPRIMPIAANEKAAFKIKLAISGHLIEEIKPIRETELIQRAEKLIENEIRQTFEEGVKKKADILNLYESLYRKNPKAFHRLVKGGELPLSNDTLQSIEVKVNIEHAGKKRIGAENTGS